MIEKYWDDVTVYYVEFTAIGRDSIIRTHRKTLGFNNDINPKDVIDLIKTYFSNIVEVLNVDEIAEGLFLKNEIQAITT